MVSIIGVGDNTVDCYLHLGKMFPGGNAVNVPVLAHRYGASTSYLGWLADDARGKLIKESLESEDIDLTHCRVVDGENAFCEVNIVDGERVFGQYSEGVCDQLSLTEHDFSFISKHDLVHTSLYSFIEPYLPALKEKSKALSFDFTSDWDQDYLQSNAKYVDIAILSSQASTLEENRDMMVWLYQQGPKIVLVTGGEQGALLYSGQEFFFQPVIPSANVIDTLGAGDAFAARFLVEYLKGTSMQDALHSAGVSAADTCGYHGAFGYGAPITVIESIMKEE
jgi:fructoselysine 6-kinase